MLKPIFALAAATLAVATSQAAPTAAQTEASIAQAPIEISELGEFTALAQAHGLRAYLLGESALTLARAVRNRAESLIPRGAIAPALSLNEVYGEPRVLSLALVGRGADDDFLQSISRQLHFRLRHPHSTHTGTDIAAALVDAMDMIAISQPQERSVVTVTHQFDGITIQNRYVRGGLSKFALRVFALETLPLGQTQTTLAGCTLGAMREIEGFSSYSDPKHTFLVELTDPLNQDESRVTDLLGGPEKGWQTLENVIQPAPPSSVCESLIASLPAGP
jgi:hypothetical protein